MRYFVARARWFSLAFAVSIVLKPAFGQGENSRVAPIELIGRDLIVLMNSLNQGVNDPTKTLPREPMIDRAMDAVGQTPLFKITALSQKQANAKLSEIDSAYYPQVDGGVNSGRRTYTTTTASSGGYSGGYLYVTQRLFDFGALEVQRGSVLDQISISKQSEERQRSELLLTAVRLFYETQRSLIQVRLARENLQARRALVNFIRERTELGASSIADVVRAETQVADGLDLLSSSLKNLSQAQARYREFYLDEAQPYILPTEPEVEDVSNAGLEDYLKDHPALIEADLKVSMALKNYESTKAAKKGTVNLEFKYNQTAAFAGSSASQDRTLMITYARSIYSGGAEDARSQQAYIAVEEARLERERLAQEMTKKIRDSLAEYNGQVASLRSRLMVFKGAEDAYAITKDLYAFSRSSLFELLRAQETLYSSGQKLIDSIIDRALSKYQLLFDTNQLLKLAKASKPE